MQQLRAAAGRSRRTACTCAFCGSRLLENAGDTGFRSRMCRVSDAVGRGRNALINTAQQGSPRVARGSAGQWERGVLLTYAV